MATKYGADYDGGKFYKSVDGVTQEVSGGEYYANKFQGEVSGPQAMAANYINRKSMPFQKVLGDNPRLSVGAEAGKEQHPYWSMAGDAAAYAEPMPSGWVRGGLSAAGQGAALSNPGDELFDATLGYIGERAGDISGRVLGRIYNAVTGKGVEAPTEMGKEFMKMGGPTTPGERTGSRWLQQVEKDFRRLPGASQVMQEADNAKKAFLNRKMVESVGLNADKFPRLSEEAVDQVFKNYSDVVYPMFENIGKVDLPAHIVEGIESMPGITSGSNLRQWKILYNADYTPAKIVDGKVVEPASMSIDGKGLREIRNVANDLAAKKSSSKSTFGKLVRRDMDEFTEELVPEGGLEDYARQRRNVNIMNAINTSTEGNLRPGVQVYNRLKDMPYDDPSFNELKNSVMISASDEFNELITKQGVSDTGGMLEQLKSLYAKPLAEAYMSGKYVPPGLLVPSPSAFPKTGGMIGRGLLQGNVE